jgi:CcmD family protein
MTYLFAAYGIFWALTFAFVFRIATKQRQLEKELEDLNSRPRTVPDSQHSSRRPLPPSGTKLINCGLAYSPSLLARTRPERAPGPAVVRGWPACRAASCAALQSRV